MPRWVVVAKPSSELTPVDGQPSAHPDGGTQQEYVTKLGVRFVRRELPGGFTVWFQEVEE